MKKSNLVIGMLPIAALFALASSTRCFAETSADDTKAEAKVVKANNKVKVNLSSPEATVRTFVAAINAGDVDAMIACIYGAKPLVGKDGAAFRATVAKDAAQGRSPNLAIGEVKIIIDTKPIRFETAVHLVEREKPLTIPSLLEMTRADDGWKIIPLSKARLLADEESKLRSLADEESPTQSLKPDVLLFTASMLAQMTQDMGASREGVLLANCMSNLRQVALAAMQLSQDRDEKFDFTQGNFVTKLNVFAHDERIFLDPKTDFVFGMNPQMENAGWEKSNRQQKRCCFTPAKTACLISITVAQPSSHSPMGTSKL